MTVGVDEKLGGGGCKVGGFCVDGLNETWEVTGRGGTEGIGLLKVGLKGGDFGGGGAGGSLGTKCGGGRVVVVGGSRGWETGVGGGRPEL